MGGDVGFSVGGRAGSFSLLSFFSPPLPLPLSYLIPFLSPFPFFSLSI